MARVDDFRELLFRLLPPGDLLSQDSDSNLAALFDAFARELERIESLGETILVDLDPRITALFLADWERVLVLPECGGELGTTPERRGAAHAKLSAERNLSAAYIQAACAAAGFTVTVTPSATVDHQFDVDLPSIEMVWFRMGESSMGDRLGAWGNTELVCLLDRLKPAHTTYVLTTP